MTQIGLLLMGIAKLKTSPEARHSSADVEMAVQQMTETLILVNQMMTLKLAIRIQRMAIAISRMLIESDRSDMSWGD